MFKRFLFSSLLLAVLTVPFAAQCMEAAPEPEIPMAKWKKKRQKAMREVDEAKAKRFRHIDNSQASRFSKGLTKGIALPIFAYNKHYRSLTGRRRQAVAAAVALPTAIGLGWFLKERLAAFKKWRAAVKDFDEGIASQEEVDQAWDAFRGLAKYGNGLSIPAALSFAMIRDAVTGAKHVTKHDIGGYDYGY